LPDVTPTSTAPRSPGRRNKLWLAVQIILTAVLLWFVGKKLVDQWDQFRNIHLAVQLRWGMLALSGAITLATFCLLIETWRRMILAWKDVGAEQSLTFADAAAVWFVSSLVRYLPGSFVVQLGALAELARRKRVSPVAATGASVINTSVNIASGFVVALAAGFSALDTLSNHHAFVGAIVAVAMLLVLVLLPDILPVGLRLVKRFTGRDLPIAQLPRRAIYISVAGNLVAWLMYGLAYMALVAGVIGHAAGSPIDYMAVYAAAYVIGYLFVLLPAGAGIREGVQFNALPMLGLATAPQATLIAVTARLLSMILEIAPGLLFLTRGTGLRPQSPKPVDGSKR
jgi:hypothetical protein